MMPTFPKIVPRRVIALAVLIILAVIIGITLSKRVPHDPNFYLTPAFYATLTPR
jgi:hypothetical protein